MQNIFSTSMLKSNSCNIKALIIHYYKICVIGRVLKLSVYKSRDSLICYMYFKIGRRQGFSQCEQYLISEIHCDIIYEKSFI